MWMTRKIYLPQLAKEFANYQRLYRRDFLAQTLLHELKISCLIMGTYLKQTNRRSYS